MAVCGNCGAEGTRIRSRWVDGIQLPDECPFCAPQSFERMRSVRDGQISCAWEYDHKHYKLKDGIPQITDEGLQDLQDAACKEAEDDELAYRKAVEEKRRNRRVAPMTPTEIEIACNRYRNESRESQSVN